MKQKGIILLIIGVLIANVVLAQSKHSISGQVNDDVGPMPGIIVVLEQTGYHSVTDVDGKFRLLNVPDGSYKLLVTGLGFEPFKKDLIVSGKSIALGVITMQYKMMDKVVVTASTRPSEVKALNMMKTAPIVSNVVSSEGVAKLPDRNVAEAVQRLPGVVMETDQGEGRFISFRGTPSDWSSALVNGDRMPVADEESKTRAMNFDIFPSSLIDYIVVAKTLTPDIEGDAIGGSANFITKSAPVKQVMQASVGLGYNAQAQKPLYNATLSYGNRSKNKKFGYLVGGSIYERNWATDNYQIFYSSNIDHSLTRLELRDYEGKRTTVGLNAAVDYEFSNRVKVYAKGVYGSMQDDEYNRKTMYNWSTGVGQSIKLQNIHNIQDSKFWGVEAGTEINVTDKLQANIRIARYDNRFQYGAVPYKDKNDPRNGYHVVEFEKQVFFRDFLYLDDQGNQTDEANAYYRAKLLNIDSPIPGYGDDYQNIQPVYENIIPVSAEDTMFKFSRAYSETNRTYERDPIVAQLDLNYSASNNLQIKFGGKLRMKEGERKVGLELWDRSKDYPNAILYDTYNPQPLDEKGGFLQELNTPYQGNMYPFLSKDVLNNFVENMGDTLVHRPFGVQTPYFEQVIGSSYKYTEDVYAGYAMATWTPAKRLTIVGGLRAEYTKPTVTADTIVTIDKALGTVALQSVTSGEDYWSLLPMMNMKYELSKNQNARFAVTRTFRRPNFNEIKPGAATIDYTNNDLVYGNPLLKPTYSWNFDIAYEYYMGRAGMFSIGGFYKDVKDHIYTAFESSSTDNSGISNEFQIPGGVIAKKFQNAPTAFAAGFEVSIISKFRFLPSFLKNFGASANYSYTYSEMKIEAREKAQALPRQSPNVLNLALFYESDKVTTRIGLNYRDPYLYELNLYAVKDPNTNEHIIVHQDNDYDVFIGKSLTVDYSFSYQFLKHFSAFLEVNNLLNTPYVKYRGRVERPVKTEYYSIRGLVGIKYNL